MWSEVLTKGPYIRFAAELCVAENFRRWPFHWVLGTKWTCILIVNHKPDKTLQLSNTSSTF